MSDENITLDGLVLPGDIEWPDRLDPWRIGQDVQTSVEGALIIHEAVRQAGRQITLQTGNNGNRWWGAVSFETAEALRDMADDGGTYTLSIPTATPEDPQVFAVRFLQDGPALEARPIKHIFPPVPGDWWAITLRFIVVE